MMEEHIRWTVGKEYLLDIDQGRWLLKELDAARARIAELEAEREMLLKQIRAAQQWYWPEDDTSSDACMESHYDCVRDARPGEVVGVSCGGVVWTRYYAWLPPADDADSDDDFWIDASSKEEAERLVQAERYRRAALEEPSDAD